jgi:hypothetical protein
VLFQADREIVQRRCVGCRRVAAPTSYVPRDYAGRLRRTNRDRIAAEIARRGERRRVCPAPIAGELLRCGK